MYSSRHATILLLPTSHSLLLLLPTAFYLLYTSFVLRALPVLRVLSQDGKRAHVQEATGRARHPPSALGSEVEAAFTSAAHHSTAILAAQRSAHYSKDYIEERVLGHGRAAFLELDHQHRAPGVARDHRV